MTIPSREAAGFVLYRTTDEGRKFLLLRNALHGTWGFPKGHRDGDEELLETARRELLEETGLTDVVVDPDFEYLTEYEVRHTKHGLYHKRVFYYVAGLASGRLEISDEHDAARWVDLHEARLTIQFEDTKKILMAAENHLKDRESD